MKHPPILSLAEAATSIIFVATNVLSRKTRVCRDKSMLAAAKRLSRQNYACRDKVFLSRQNVYRDKDMFVATKVLSRQKAYFVATNLLL